MANRNDSEINGYTFQWSIENFPYWLQKGKRIISPSFIADSLEATKWSLRLYPMGSKSENFVSLYLGRENDCGGPDKKGINYQLAFMDEDGVFLTKRIAFGDIIAKGGYRGFKEFEARKKVFVTERESFLSKDTLRVQCKIWKKDETCEKSRCLSARTVFKANRISFVWKIENFSSLKPCFRNKVKNNLMEFHHVLNEGPDFEKKIVIDVISLQEGITFFSLKTSIIDSKGEKEDCGIYEYFADDLKKGILSAPLLTKKLTENKSRYLPNDVLTLACEHVSSDGTVLYELFADGILNPHITNVAVEKSKEQCVHKKKHPHTPYLADESILSDLKSMYDDSIFCDIELRTSTQTFQGHKSILSARSPVFFSMFRNDMKERNSGHIDILDLEDDTIHRMLKYIYTDSLEDMQLESACKLYTASDKYQIVSMKRRCSSFLKENLCPNKACDVLILADLHQDDDLKSAVQDYILEHDREVFSSQEWKNFMDTDSKLAARVMYQKVFPN